MNISMWVGGNANGDDNAYIHSQTCPAIWWNSTKEVPEGECLQQFVEEMLRDYALSLYETTNGVYYLGKVTLLRGDYPGKIASTDLFPWAGIAIADGQLFLRYGWGDSALYAPYNLGRTMDHEMGHSYFNIKDEYVQRTSFAYEDKKKLEPIPSLMANEFVYPCEREMSSEYNYPHNPFTGGLSGPFYWEDGTATQKQGPDTSSIVSGWELMTMPVIEQEAKVTRNRFFSLAYYSFPELTAVKPTKQDTCGAYPYARKNMNSFRDTAAALSQLKIQWRPPAHAPRVVYLFDAGFDSSEVNFLKAYVSTHSFYSSQLFPGTLAKAMLATATLPDVTGYMGLAGGRSALLHALDTLAWPDTKPSVLLDAIDAAIGSIARARNNDYTFDKAEIVAFASHKDTSSVMGLDSIATGLKTSGIYLTLNCLDSSAFVQFAPLKDMAPRFVNVRMKASFQYGVTFGNVAFSNPWSSADGASTFGVLDPRTNIDSVFFTTSGSVRSKWIPSSIENNLFVIAADTSYHMDSSNLHGKFRLFRKVGGQYDTLSSTKLSLQGHFVDGRTSFFVLPVSNSWMSGADTVWGRLSFSPVKAYPVAFSFLTLDTALVQAAAQSGIYISAYTNYPNPVSFSIGSRLPSSKLVVSSPSGLQDTLALAETAAKDSLYSSYREGGIYTATLLDSSHVVRGSSQFYLADVRADDHPAQMTGIAELVANNQRRMVGRLDNASDQDWIWIKPDSSKKDFSVRVLRLPSNAPLIGELADPSGLHPSISFDPNLIGQHVQIVPKDWHQGAVLKLKATPGLSAPVPYQVSAGPDLAVDRSWNPTLLVATRDEMPSSSQQTTLCLRVTNTGSYVARDLKVRWYFNTEWKKVPQFDTYYPPGLPVQKIQLGDDLWALEFDLAGVVLAPGEAWPQWGEAKVGLHYADWSIWNKANDWSGMSGSENNARAWVSDRAGNTLQGQFPVDGLFPEVRALLRQVQVRSREEAVAGEWSMPRLWLDNYGDSLDSPKMYYQFTAENGKVPELHDWSSPNASLAMEHVDGELWQVVVDYLGLVLPPEGKDAWKTEVYFGLRYTDGSAWDRSNDPSALAGAWEQANPHIRVTTRAGETLPGDSL